jgi:hypothetical protein
VALKDDKLQTFFANLFEGIEEHVSKSLVRVTISPFDLYHGHLFLSAEHQQIGILFHCKEYPRYDADKFPYHLGYCQENSTCEFDAKSFQLRNLLWMSSTYDSVYVLDVMHESVGPFVQEGSLSTVDVV